MHMARIELALTASFASQHGMKLKFASIPVAMRYAGSLDFETANMRNLFNFAHACAANDLLWRDMKDARVPASGTDSSETDCGNRALPPEPASQMATE
jgi:hypothetical protein